MDLSLVAKACSKPPEKRSPKDLETIRRFTRPMKLFADKRISNKKCSQCLYYEFYPQDSYVFKAGNPTDKLYIVITGCVQIEVIIGTATKTVAEIADGAWIEELDLQDNKPHASSAKCIRDTHFFYLLKTDYLMMFDKHVNKKRIALIQFLKQIPAFKTLSSDAIKKLTYNLKEKEIKRHQVLYSEGDFDDRIYIVLNGELVLSKKIMITKQNGLRSVRRYLNKNLLILEKGEILGDYEAAQGTSREFSCVCSVDGTVLETTYDEFCKRVNREEIIKFLENRSYEQSKNMNSRAKVWEGIENEKGKALSPRSKLKRNPSEANVNELFRDKFKSNLMSLSRRKQSCTYFKLVPQKSPHILPVIKNREISIRKLSQQLFPSKESHLNLVPRFHFKTKAL